MQRLPIARDHGIDLNGHVADCRRAPRNRCRGVKSRIHHRAKASAAVATVLACADQALVCSGAGVGWPGSNLGNSAESFADGQITCRDRRRVKTTLQLANPFAASGLAFAAWMVS
jgi:hypothetical protein